MRTMAATDAFVRLRTFDGVRYQVKSGMTETQIARGSGCRAGDNTDVSLHTQKGREPRNRK